MEELVINIAPTGLVPTKADNPAVPVAEDEIVEDVLACAGLGASIVHLHARRPDGAPTSDPEPFARMIAAIRERRPDLIMCVSTSGRVASGVDQRAVPLGLEGAERPDMASLTLGSMNFARSASVNAPDTIIGLAERMRDAGIKPELEVFDLGMVNFAHYLAGKGLIQPPYYFNVLVGNVGTAQASLHHLGALVADLPRPCVWSVAGIGNAQPRAHQLGIACADGVRAGLEDNLWMDEARAIPATNKALVERVADTAELWNRGISSATRVRERLGLA